MKINLFIRLYLLIVASIIVIGVAVNWIWQNDFIQQVTSQESTPLETDSSYKIYEPVIKLIAFQLEKISKDKLIEKTLMTQCFTNK